MTREEAITVLKAFMENPLFSDVHKNAFNIAIHDIKQLEQEPCEDCISRTDAIEALGYDISIESDEGLDAYKTVIKEMICKIYDVQKENIEKLPSVKQEPKTGHWNCGDDMFEYAICSSCKHETGEAWEYAKRNFNYCPNCGAKMIEPQESEEK